MSISDRLAAITARADNATEGPWEAAYVYPDGPCDIVQIGRDEYGQEWASEQIADRVESLGDGEFISHARADVPWLVEQVRTRDAALRAVLAYVEHCEGDYFMHADDIREAIEAALGEDR